MRVFVAFIPSDEAIEHLDEFLDVRRAAAPLRWTDPDQFHVTLAFSASMPSSSLDDLTERLDRFAARHRPFHTAITGGGAFPHPADAKVLWAGLDLSDAERQRMGRLSHDVRQVATKAGVPVDGGRFKAHVTVARSRPTEMSNWVRLLDSYRGPEWDADQLCLVESHLGEGRNRRPRYVVLERFGLRPD